MNLENVSRWLIAFGLLILGIITYIFLNHSTVLNSNYSIDSDIWGNYGEIVSGIVGVIFSLVGILFLVINLREQRRSFTRQLIETRFFNLIEYHRENVKSFQSMGKSGLATFIQIKDEFHELFESTTSVYKKEETTKNYDEWQSACIQIAYLITFFGINNTSTTYLKKLIKQILSDEAIYNKFEKEFLNAKIIFHQKVKDENKSKTIKSYLKYDGHQSLLGMYYRHLYQTVTYINDQPTRLLTYNEKYNYIKTLRAQLSTHEQALFLYNSISPLGEAWALSSSITDENQKLITKYNLIKNLPEDFTKEINPKDYYPNIFYEFDATESEERLNLKKLYW